MSSKTPSAYHMLCRQHLAAEVAVLQTLGRGEPRIKALAERKKAAYVCFTNYSRSAMLPYKSHVLVSSRGRSPYA